MPPIVAQDPLGFSRLVAQNNANRQLSIQEQDADRRSELQTAQLGQIQAGETSRLGKIARQQKMREGLSQAVANIPEGESRFTVAHNFLQSNGFVEEAAELRAEQGKMIDSLNSDEAQAQAFNQTLGRVEGVTLKATSPKELGKPFEATNPAGDSVFLVRDDATEGGFKVLEGFTPPVEQDAKSTVFKDETSLRKEFVKDSSEFIKSRDALSRVRAAGKDPSAAGDLALIFNFMKVLDPGSVVRESEFATAANAAGVPDRVRNQYNRIVNGERLAKDQRHDFLSRAEKLFAPIQKTHTRREVEFKGIANRNKINPENVILDLSIEDLEKPPLDTATATAILEEAGGDKAKARQIATERGFKL